MKYNAKYRQSIYQARQVLNSIRNICLARGIENYIRPHTRLESFLEILNCFHETLKRYASLNRFSQLGDRGCVCQTFKQQGSSYSRTYTKRSRSSTSTAYSQPALRVFLYTTGHPINFNLKIFLLRKLSKNLNLKQQSITINSIMRRI